MKIIISNSADEPIYEQITTQIKNNIFNEQLNEGDALPSIRNLAIELRISVSTTKRAYEKLEMEGFINTVPGKGSYVAGQNKELLRERKIKIIEDKLTEAIEESKFIDLSLDDLKKLLDILSENTK
ncbi:GntR family transcriptional regulator [Clostridium estertheticum]|uniref:GntR family transcriptional regulator n=1 Tax=Clostridium estertheticum TaxID=238834 RepID=A0AA47I4Q4_9CLOT|nr:GntR family transcriptional regulator [Clostridium estertheticum]MBU3155034.1 GntR family transcriptional regulator [Clostridium estertheticum]MBU3201767.1 GntR family transcriptional regulator [Clostridium estertheticum]WAG58853.1 GntR family transcriptional regulator [Clostridium estertheticum]WAG67105.1 GntR family transcriptional regulator [Clostridium estertheticum]